jgi:3-oxoacyl-[acyl-carrier protein] reductase
VGSLTGKVAVVTGGSRGIGADTARLLARDGAEVVVDYRDKARRAEQVVREIEGADVPDGHTVYVGGADYLG